MGRSVLFQHPIRDALVHQGNLMVPSSEMVSLWVQVTNNHDAALTIVIVGNDNGGGAGLTGITAGLPIAAGVALGFAVSPDLWAPWLGVEFDYGAAAPTTGRLNVVFSWRTWQDLERPTTITVGPGARAGSRNLVNERAAVTPGRTRITPRWGG